MNHADHVRLLAGGVPGPGGVWADMGAGDGAFTLALRDLAGPEVNQGALRQLADRVRGIFPGTRLEAIAADMTGPLTLERLDGIIAANSLHFVDRRKQAGVLREWRDLLRPGGRLIVVEYDADEGNRWVPFPVSFRALQRLAVHAGYEAPGLLASRPSHFLHSIYSAMLQPAQRPFDLE
jgi:SAM-dependent methyltransferase